ncbi:putative PHB depolymerase family esterase [Colletotrichum sublineola]|uniref:Putative PHB depolymerase family esterase n=1 Tax=Colletotrichum sublineola TaxID=1173701 RepID=A0A066X146_COLSU|nr:putative PHB depolymerase family esterase [Colletotrichum sublineola]
MFRRGASPQPGTTTRSSAPPPATSAASPPPAGGCTVARWGQCGGSGWTGCTACESPYTCQVSNQWYSQCL